MKLVRPATCASPRWKVLRLRRLRHPDARQVPVTSLGHHYENELHSKWLCHADARQVSDLPKRLSFKVRVCDPFGTAQKFGGSYPASQRLAAHQHGRAISPRLKGRGWVKKIDHNRGHESVEKVLMEGNYRVSAGRHSNVQTNLNHEMTRRQPPLCSCASWFQFLSACVSWQITRHRGCLSRLASSQFLTSFYARLTPIMVIWAYSFP